jgi:hypothetical protein
MNMLLMYLAEKFYQAVCELAVGEGDARSRVKVAYRRFWHIPIEDFPAELQKERREIDHLLTRLPGRKGYIIPDNLRAMKNRTAAKIAFKIVRLYFQLDQLRAAEPSEKP